MTRNSESSRKIGPRNIPKHYITIIFIWLFWSKQTRKKNRKFWFCIDFLLIFHWFPDRFWPKWHGFLEHTTKNRKKIDEKIKISYFWQRESILHAKLTLETITYNIPRHWSFLNKKNLKKKSVLTVYLSFCLLVFLCG